MGSSTNSRSIADHGGSQRPFQTAKNLGQNTYRQFPLPGAWTGTNVGDDDRPPSEARVSGITAKTGHPHRARRKPRDLSGDARTGWRRAVQWDRLHQFDANTRAD